MIKKTPIITAPALVDRPIEAMACKIREALPWLSAVYGRAFRMVRQRQGHTEYYPCVHDTSGEYISMYPDEMTGNTAFFVVEETHRFDKWAKGAKNRMTCNFSIVFWYDITKVYPGALDFNTEAVRRDILEIFRTMTIPYGTFRLTGTSEKEVYRSFDLKEVQHQYMMYPFHALRVDGVLSYLEDCE
jgi:hypothetical protein